MRRQAFTSDEFRLLIAGLGNDISQAAIHYRLYQGLLEALRDYGRAMREHWTFWSLTIVAHRDAAIFRLCRVYDQEESALGLPNWLEAIRVNAHLFDEKAFRDRLRDNPFVESLAATARKPETEQLKEDVKLVSTDNADVKTLAILRNNLFAHHSPTYALHASAFLEGYPLSTEAVWRLIEQATTILNRYSTLFQAQIYSTQIVGGEDYLTLLRIIEDRLYAIERDFRNATPP